MTFEGIDGGGKSTQIERLRARLASVGCTVVCTREPGGTPIGDVIRGLLLDDASRKMAAQAEALLYAASRAQLVREVIRPALDGGSVVLCDRYVDASIAYQGAGLGIDIDSVTRINQFATGGLQPQVTFLFDLPVSTSKQRVQGSREGLEPDRIEQRDDEYFNCVRSAFLHIADADPERVVVLDALQSPDQLEEEIWRRAANLLGLAESSD